MVRLQARALLTVLQIPCVLQLEALSYEPNLGFFWIKKSFGFLDWIKKSFSFFDWMKKNFECASKQW